MRTELLKGADVLLLHCGRMSKEKNPQNSILALKELVEAGVNARLIFVGMGPMFKSLKELSKDLPVTFMGYIVDRKMLAEIIASADVSIAPGPMKVNSWPRAMYPDPSSCNVVLIPPDFGP